MRMDGQSDRPDAAIIDDVLARGRTEAYGELVERYTPRLIGLGVHLCGDYDTACDLAQETLIAAYRCLDRLRDPAAFGPWAASILRNRLRDLQRRGHDRCLSLDQLMGAGFDPPEPDSDPRPSDEEVEQAMACLDALPEKYRRVLLLRYFQDLSYKQIGKALGLAVTTVTTRLAYARRILLRKAREGGLI